MIANVKDSDDHPDYALGADLIAMFVAEATIAVRGNGNAHPPTICPVYDDAAGARGAAIQILNDNNITALDVWQVNAVGNHHDGARTVERRDPVRIGKGTLKGRSRRCCSCRH